MHTLTFLLLATTSALVVSGTNQLSYSYPTWDVKVLNSDGGGYTIQQYDYNPCNKACPNVEQCVVTIACHQGQCTAVPLCNYHYCEQKKHDGDCSQSLEKFFYDTESGKCMPFTYTGCGGNCNRFNNRRWCNLFCGNIPEKFQRCYLPRKRGNCGRRIARFYFDHTIGKCLKFWFSGCGGNRNNFPDRQSCRSACRAVVRPDDSIHNHDSHQPCSTERPVRFDAIVIGAGISGLTAAYTIKKRDPAAKVVVLEALDRVGGRTHSVQLNGAKGKDFWDVGGQWVGLSQVHVMRLIKELGISTYNQYITGDFREQLGGQRVDSYHRSAIPSFPPLALADLALWTLKISQFVKEIDVRDPFVHEKAPYWDSITLKAHGLTTLWTREAKEFVDILGRNVFGVEPDEISFLFFLVYVKQAVDLETLLGDGEEQAQGIKITGGAQTISLKLLEKLGADNVKLNEPVMSITQNNDTATVVTASGWTGTASRVIIAMPPKAVERVEFSPPLSRDRVDFMKRIPMGNYIKVVVTYDKPFWRTKGMTGAFISSGPLDTDGLPAPISAMLDSTSPTGNAALAGFISGRNSVIWSGKPAEQRKQAVLKHLAAAFGDEALSNIDYIEKDWNLEPFNYGGPVGGMGVGGMDNFARSIRKPEGNIHWAGTEAATVWTGYFSGAVESGERAALEVVRAISPDRLTVEDDHLLSEFDRVNKIVAERNLIH